MTDQNHPITPPYVLVQKLWDLEKPDDALRHISAEFARWGADQELEACCEWADATGWEGAGDSLRAARRPKPPSLKEQALERCNDYIDPDGIIRRALEQLDD